MSESVKDEFGFIDWEANGWPEPNPYGDGDMSTMPHDVWEVWIEACEFCEMLWENDDGEWMDA